MSVRLWLLLAQCWQCHTQIALTEEQQAAVDQLLAEREAATSPGSPATSEPATADTSAPGETQQTLGAEAEVASATTSELTPPQPTAPAERRGRRLRLPAPATPSPSSAASENSAHHWRRHSSSPRRSAPAWLVSLVLHFVLLLLLALLAISDYREIDSITLTSFVSPEDREGGLPVQMEESLAEQFELPIPPDVDPSDAAAMAELQEASDEAAEIRDDPDPVVEMPDVERVREKLTADVAQRSHFIARDPRLRIEMVRTEGGSTLTEAAVSRGLAWLARHQNDDGSWSLEDYEDSHRPGNRGDAAATALALLPFLGAGQTHEYGRYKETVSAGLMWLISRQLPNGDLRAGMKSQMGMYAHGQASIVLVEALAMTGDERFRGPAQRAIDFICAAQHDEGGWRYRPGQAGDTSVLGWQLMALQSARSPGLGLEVPDTVLKLASYYLDLASSAEGALYAYQPNTKRRPTPTMTAEALLCRMYLGWPHDDPRLQAGIEWFVENAPPSPSRKNIYYWYYATQTLHNYSGPRWDTWNTEMREILVELQDKRGRNAGSWNPRGFEYGNVGDRIYVTALAVCTLEVYYRHLPIFRRVELSEAE